MKDRRWNKEFAGKKSKYNNKDDYNIIGLNFEKYLTNEPQLKIYKLIFIKTSSEIQPEARLDEKATPDWALQGVPLHHPLITHGDNCMN